MAVAGALVAGVAVAAVISRPCFPPLSIVHAEQ
jgi:hypothetical protein